MPNPNALVSTRIRLDPPLDRPAADMLRAGPGLSVELDEGRRLRLDPHDPRSAGLAGILDGLARLKQPVYLEFDPGTLAVTLLLIPHVTRVFDLREAAGGYDVEIERSQARHTLARDTADFAALEKALRAAQETQSLVILTEDDRHRIIDVRPFDAGPDGERFPPLPRPDLPSPPWRWLRALLVWIWWWPIWPWRWFRCISPRTAQQVFDAMSATSCDPIAVPVPCIPFLYPDDGCWGRAHEMCRLMINMGRSPCKIWIQGSLHTPTRNNPNCFVNWGWHVAPTLCVRKGLFSAQPMVIDPSLFTTPVTEATWKGVQGDPGATLTPSAASIFYLWGNVTDPTYAQTNQVLATYRLQLQNRAIQQGPPPYANCP